jgi:ABC-type dipeptide/oligopeptide/nickel transport system ATPase subunit
MVFQGTSNAVNPRFKAKQILAEPIRNFRGLSGKALNDEVAHLLEMVGIANNEANKLPSEFSGGQPQRISIARALAAKPKLIVLDEPLRGLDVSVQAQILNLLDDLRKMETLSFLLINHDLEAVYYLSNRLSVLFGELIMEQIDDMSLYGQTRHPYTTLLKDSSEYRLSDLSDDKSKVGFNYAGCPLLPPLRPSPARASNRNPQADQRRAWPYNSLR